MVYNESMTIEYILEFVLALAILIITHELGHFLACRLLKVEVEEFGVGLPPRAMRLFRLGGTEFTLNWLPFGGFVRPKGENDPHVAGGLAAAKPAVRIGVALAGPLANLFLAVITYAVMAFLVGEPDPKRAGQVLIQGVQANSPAYVAGLQLGDLILAINHTPVNSPSQAREIIYQNLDQPVVIQYRRGETVASVTLTPLSSRTPQQGATGIQLGIPTRPIPAWKAAKYGFQFTYHHIAFLIQSVGRLLTGQLASENAQLVGPIGMGRLYVDVRENAPVAGAIPLLDVLTFLTNVTVTLAVLNLLPVPALDGGRVLLALPELFFRKRLNPRIETALITTTLLLLLGFMLLVSLQDVLVAMR